MLRPDVVVTELACFLDRELEHPLCLRSEGHLPERELLGESGEGALDFRLHDLEPQSATLEHRSRDSFPGADEAEKNVLGADGIVAETAPFLPGHDEDQTCPFGESFKQWRSSPHS